MNSLLQDLTMDEWQELYRKEGRTAGREEIARNMKNAGEPIEKILKFTGLSHKIVKTL